MNVGLFFGSFNPVHTGHLILAQTALNETPLDYVWFVVSPQNPFKEKRSLLPEYDRLRMVELAIGDHARMQASNVEFSLPQPSYTIDTLTHLRDRYRSYDFALIMGQDNLQYFPKWKKHQTILDHYHLYVYPRSGAAPSELDRHPAVTVFDAPLLDLSATYLRQAVQAGKSIRYMVPEAVYDYITRAGLFRSPASPPSSGL
ncbi:MAG: nicotinate (nicotinamide) nucleotide adenylyltransferase [Bacteroidia bacterium]|nr:nicotinate (nicotinamide) nucleotide adenylyltransferase [Bacteroidia bacterium]